MVNFGPLAAEIVSLVWGTPGNFNGFRVLAALLHGTLVVGVSQTAALNRGSHLYSAGRPSRWALAHISSLIGISHAAPQNSCIDVVVSFSRHYSANSNQIVLFGTQPVSRRYSVCVDSFVVGDVIAVVVCTAETVPRCSRRRRPPS